MSYIDQNNFFALAYRTGTDNWTNIPFSRRAHELTLYVPKGGLVLDIGAGRGKTMFELASLGFRVIGLENNPDLIARGNETIKDRGLGSEVRFVHGDVLAIPLADKSFDAVVDMGLLQHMKPEDFKIYVEEIARALKQGGLFFLVVLSKKTENFFSWHPRKSDTSDFLLEGVRYHFFSDDEIKALFEPDFDIRYINYDMPFGEKDTIYTVALMRKK